MKKIRAALLTLILAGTFCLVFNVAPMLRAEMTEDYSSIYPWCFIEDVGTYFEITNSAYLNITLTSTEIVHVILESIQGMVNFFIEKNSSVTSTVLAFSGFEPSTTYYRHQDGYLIEEFTTDSGGGYAYVQDISEPHHMFISEFASTLYIYSDYTFTSDIHEPIVVRASNIVIDGNGYTLQAAGMYGFYLYGRSGVTIKNVIIQGWICGIYLGWDGSSNNMITGNNLTNNFIGAYLMWSDHNTIVGNTFQRNFNGISLTDCPYNLIYHNNLIDNVWQAYDLSLGLNHWHHPDLLEGNYWSDYLGVDDGSGAGKHAIAGDGIGDTNIPWPGTGYDYYPLMFTWISDPVKGTQELIETIESWNLPKGTKNCLTSKLDEAILLLNQGNVNGAIHKLGDLIKQVENDRKDLTEEQREELLLRARAIIFAIS